MTASDTSDRSDPSVATDDGQRLHDHLDGVRTVMLTSLDDTGSIRSRPLTLLERSTAGDLWFLVDRQAAWVGTGMDAVDVSVVATDLWMSMSGRAVVDDDPQRIEELSTVITDAYFEQGDDPVALHVVVDRADVWTAPNKLRQLVGVATAIFKDERPDLGDREELEP